MNADDLLTPTGCAICGEALTMDHVGTHRERPMNAEETVAYVFYWADALRSGTVSDAEFKRRIASGMTKSEKAVFEEGQREMRERCAKEAEHLNESMVEWQIRRVPLTTRGGEDSK